jgi:hypothetical protein
VATPALLASIHTIDHAGGGLTGKRTVVKTPVYTLGRRDPERGLGMLKAEEVAALLALIHTTDHAEGELKGRR